MSCSTDKLIPVPDDDDNDDDDNDDCDDYAGNTTNNHRYVKFTSVDILYRIQIREG
jgi:hypothetical protein